MRLCRQKNWMDAMLTRKLLMALAFLLFLFPQVVFAVDACVENFYYPPDLPTARYRTHGALVDGSFYVIGGMDGTNLFSENEAWDPWSNTWTSMADAPDPLANACVVALGTQIHTLGGYVNGFASSDAHYVYDTLSDTWGVATALPVPLYGAYCGVDGNKIFVAGGTNDSTTFNTLHIYDDDTGTWSLGAPMPVAKCCGEGALLNGYFYAIGGFPSLTSNEIYDIAGNSWTSGAVMPEGRQSGAVSVYAKPDGEELIFYMGGGDGWTAKNNFFQYSPLGDEWFDYTGAFPIPTALEAQAGGNYGGSLLMSIGGATAISTPTGEFIYFNTCIPYLLETAPAYAIEGVATPLAVTGLNFDDFAYFWLEAPNHTTYNLTGAVISTDKTATATVPASVPAGDYLLWVSAAFNEWTMPFSVLTSTPTTTTTTTTAGSTTTTTSPPTTTTSTSTSTTTTSTSTTTTTTSTSTTTTTTSTTTTTTTTSTSTSTTTTSTTTTSSSTTTTTQPTTTTTTSTSTSTSTTTTLPPTTTTTTTTTPPTTTTTSTSTTTTLPPTTTTTTNPPTTTTTSTSTPPTTSTTTTTAPTTTTTTVVSTTSTTSTTEPGDDTSDDTTMDDTADDSGDDDASDDNLDDDGADDAKDDDVADDADDGTSDDAGDDSADDSAPPRSGDDDDGGGGGMCG
jgi:hypothetical protein